MRMGFEDRIEPPHPFSRNDSLGPANIGGCEDRLTLKIARIDHIIVDQCQPTNSCCRQILQRGRADPTAADQHDMALRQCNLPRPAYFGQDDVTGKAVKAGRQQCHLAGLEQLAREVKVERLGCK